MSQTLAAHEIEAAPLVEVQKADGMLRLTLCNPPANALSLALMNALIEALEAARDDADVRVIIVAAPGKVFSAGHDLKELTRHRDDDDKGRAFYARTMSLCANLMLAITRHPKPVIAEVAGLATAAGCQLVASCDLAIASDEAAFATPGVNIGLFCSTPMVALSRNVARKQAMEMLLTGDKVTAGAALRMGLVNAVVPGEALPGEVVRLAEKIAAKSSATLKIGKQAFYEQIEMGLPDAYDYAARVMVENMMARDAREGISAFIEKRDPKWSDE